VTKAKRRPGKTHDNVTSASGGEQKIVSEILRNKLFYREKNLSYRTAGQLAASKKFEIARREKGICAGGKK